MQSLREFMKNLFRWFLSGLVILLPLGATLVLLGWALNFLDGLIGGQSFFARLWRGFFGWFLSDGTSLLLGYVFLFAVVVAVGYFARGFAKQQIVGLLRDFFGRIPLLNKIYHSVEQVMDLWSKKKEGDQISQVGEVVVVQFMNTKALGILSSRAPYMIQGEEHYLVYLPSSPIPATGFNYFFKASDVYLSDLKIDEMTKIIVSLGVLGHEILDEQISLRPLSRLHGKN
ncbi:MAG: DUF502 domain-containing protein [Candidatus Altimarinota bacterium]